jgi:CDP-glycerol glycerophosphotransferase
LSPQLSIVVPFYNVEPYLADCLESLVRQTLKDFEVVMVDDGSPDGSTVIAKSYAARDPRFRLLQQPNRGLGAARNAGVAAATGGYLAFLDGDDLVPRYAYELMTGTLEETGSDLVCGNVRRLHAGRFTPSPMHAAVFAAGPMLRTHITREPRLLGDRTAWNKVYRRAFWDRHGLAFPAGLYEDIPVTIPAHVLADSVDMLRRVVYYWRRRAAGERSLTQRRTEPGHLEDRIRAMREVLAFLERHAPELRGDYLYSILTSDLPLYVDAAPDGDDTYRAQLVALAGGLLAEAGPRLPTRLPAIQRLKYELLGREMMAELLDVLDFERDGLCGARAVRTGLLRRRWLADHPFPDRVPRAVHDVTDELELTAQVDDVRWHDDRLRITGHAYIGRVDLPGIRHGRLKLWLTETGTGDRVRLRARRIARPDVTAAARWNGACYDGAGFTADIDPQRLAEGAWELHAEVTVRGLSRTGKVCNPARVQAKWPPARQRSDGAWVRPIADGPGAFTVTACTVKTAVTGCSLTVLEGGEALVLEGSCAAGRGTPIGLVATRRLGAAAQEAPVEPLDAHRFRAWLPLTPLLDEPPADPTEQLGDDVRWDLGLRTADGGIVRLPMTGDPPELRRTVRGREFLVTTTRHGNLTVLDRPVRPVLTGAWWNGDQLTLAGSVTQGLPAALTLRHHHSTEQHECALEPAGNGSTCSIEFTCSIKPAELAVHGYVRPLGSGTWELLADGVPLALGRVAARDLPPPRVAGVHEIALTAYRQDGVALRVVPALADDERGRYAQRRLQTGYYAEQRRRPLTDTVVFDAFTGRGYTDSPRAVFTELRRRDTGLDCVWVSRDGRFAAPEGARTVLLGSREHYAALARARYVIGNSGQAAWYAKRLGQRYVQCWHGTPLRRLGHDVDGPPRRRREIERWLAREVPQWDLLISPNPPTTAIMRRACRYEGEILECGLPRNDLLSSPDRAAIAARLRTALGVPPGKRTVLYAPAYPDDPRRRPFALQLDLAHAEAALGDDHVLLLRLPEQATALDRGAAGGLPRDLGFVIDVSAYPDLTELCLAADVLLTDYSTTMVDFAVTGKPIVLFAPDLERRHDRGGGLYLDLAEEGPGPVTRTSEETVAALREVASWHPFPGYDDFAARYCPYDDGLAAARLVDHVFHGPLGH